jgi:hypothetical protein
MREEMCRNDNNEAQCAVARGFVSHVIKKQSSQDQIGRMSLCVLGVAHRDGNGSAGRRSEASDL